MECPAISAHLKTILRERAPTVRFSSWICQHHPRLRYPKGLRHPDPFLSCPLPFVPPWKAAEWYIPSSFGHLWKAMQSSFPLFNETDSRDPTKRLSRPSVQSRHGQRNKEMENEKKTKIVLPFLFDRVLCITRFHTLWRRIVLSAFSFFRAERCSDRHRRSESCSIPIHWPIVA